MRSIPLLLALLIRLQAGEPFTDNATALMWEDVPENKGVIHTWHEAKEHCEALDYGGYDDWWLPSESELFTIVDTSRPRGRMIKQGLLHFKSAPYWTATTYAWNAPHAWAIDFERGISYTAEKEERHFVRCVRCSDFKLCLERFYSR